MVVDILTDHTLSASSCYDNRPDIVDSGSNLVIRSISESTR